MPARPNSSARDRFTRKRGDSNRDSDTLSVEESEFVLRVQAGRGDTSVRQPGQREVVEDLVSSEVADWLVVDKRLGDVGVALGVVIEHPGREADRRVGNAVQGLGTVAHLHSVADAVREEEVQLVVGPVLFVGETRRPRITGAEDVGQRESP